MVDSEVVFVIPFSQKWTCIVLVECESIIPFGFWENLGKGRNQNSESSFSFPRSWETLRLEVLSSPVFSGTKRRATWLFRTNIDCVSLEVFECRLILPVMTTFGHERQQLFAHCGRLCLPWGCWGKEECAKMLIWGHFYFNYTIFELNLHFFFKQNFIQFSWFADDLG